MKIITNEKIQLKNNRNSKIICLGLATMAIGIAGMWYVLNSSKENISEIQDDNSSEFSCE